MSGQISQSESQGYYKRFANAAVRLRGIREEIGRLSSEWVSLDLGTNLDEESGGYVTKAQAGALIGELAGFREWYDNFTVAASAGEGSDNRHAALAPFFGAEKLI